MPAPAPSAPSTDPLGWFTFDRLLTSLVFLAIALAALLMPAQNDTWWHLRAGQTIAATHHVLLEDTFSYTATGAFWPNHEWLSQLLFFALYSIGGLPLLTVFCAGCVTAAWAIVWRLTTASPFAKFLLVAWVLASATTAWTLRPQVISQLLLVVAVMLLVRRRHAWLPPLFFVWANLHGAVLSGLVVVGAGIAAAAFASRRACARLAGVGLLCAVATLATPLGVHLWQEVPAFFVRIRQVHVGEFNAPQLTAPVWIPFWATAAAFVALAVARGPRLVRNGDAVARGDATLGLCAAALLAMAATAERNVGPFLLIAVPALAALLPDGWRRMERSRTEQPRLNTAAAFAAAMLVAVVVVSSYVRRSDRLRWSPLPSASFQALDACRGNVYNRFDEGGYLIWFAPTRRVFIDSRYLPYSDRFIQDHMRIEQTGDGSAAFRQYDIHCAYIPTASLLGNRLRSAGWKPLYEDPAWSVLSD